METFEAEARLLLAVKLELGKVSTGAGNAGWHEPRAPMFALNQTRPFTPFGATQANLGTVPKMAAIGSGQPLHQLLRWPWLVHCHSYKCVYSDNDSSCCAADQLASLESA